MWPSQLRQQQGDQARRDGPSLQQRYVDGQFSDACCPSEPHNQLNSQPWQPPAPNTVDQCGNAVSHQPNRPQNASNGWYTNTQLPEQRTSSIQDQGPLSPADGTRPDEARPSTVPNGVDTSMGGGLSNQEHQLQQPCVGTTAAPQTELAPLNKAHTASQVDEAEASLNQSKTGVDSASCHHPPSVDSAKSNDDPLKPFPYSQPSRSSSSTTRAALSKAQAKLRAALKAKKISLLASIERNRIKSIDKPPIRALSKCSNHSLLISNIDTGDQKVCFIEAASLIPSKADDTSSRSHTLLLKRKLEVESKLVKAREKHRRLNHGQGAEDFTHQACGTDNERPCMSRDELLRKRNLLEKKTAVTQLKHLLVKQQHEYDRQRNNLAQTELQLESVQDELTSKKAESLAVDREVVELDARRDILEVKMKETLGNLISLRQQLHELSQLSHTTPEGAREERLYPRAS